MTDPADPSSPLPPPLGWEPAEPVADVAVGQDESGIWATGWCAPSSTLYDTRAQDLASLFAPAKCPACDLPDRLDRHGLGHRDANGAMWAVTEQEVARWTHDCPRPDAGLAWTVLRALGRDPEDTVPCTCGATWTLHVPACMECGQPDGETQWSRWPPPGGAWDGTLSVARGGIRYGS